MMEICKSKGIFVQQTFIIGFPTESWDEIRQTINFAGKKLNADYTRIHILVPLKGTRMFEMVENEGYLMKDMITLIKSHLEGGTIESRNYTSNDLLFLRLWNGTG